MDRKQAFKASKRLIAKAASLYSLRDYRLEDDLKYPIGDGEAIIFKGRRMEFTDNILITSITAERDKKVNIRLKLRIRMFSDEEIQQISNSIMRIFKVSIIKRSEEVIRGDSTDVSQRQINYIGKTNNACIYLLEQISKTIVDRINKTHDAEILKGLSSRMLLFLSTVVRREMIVLNANGFEDRYSEKDDSIQYDFIMHRLKEQRFIFSAIVNELKDRGIRNIEELIRDNDIKVKEFADTGYHRLF